MTWPFENDISIIVNKLAKRSLKSEKRRNLMVVIAVALAAFLVCFTGIVSVSLVQIQRNQAADTYEAVFTGITESDVKNLKEISEFARVGEYYLLGQEPDRQGYHASYVYCDSEMLYIARNQMELVKGQLPRQSNEIAVSEYFFTVYGFDTEVGGTVRLESESFHGEYTVTGILSGGGEKETNTYAVVVSRAALEGWAGFDPAGYRAYVHFLNDRQMAQETMTARCREIADEHGLPPAGMNSNYFHAYSRSFDFTVAGSITFLVLIGGYVVIQSIFRISVGDKVKNYGQLRMIGATAKQIRCVVKRESSLLGSIGILAGVLFGIFGGFLLFPKGFHPVWYGAVCFLTVLVCWMMVSFSVRMPVRIAAGITPIQAVRFSSEREKIRSRKKRMKLSPVSMGLANFWRDRKKTVSIVISLSLGGVLLLIVASVFLTRSPEQAARLFFPDGDYKIYLSSEQSEEEIMASGNPLDDEMRQELLDIEGVEDVLVTRQSIHARFNTSSNASAGMCDMLNNANYAKVESALVSGSMPEDRYSVLLDKNNQKHYEDMDTGDTIELSLGQKTVTVTISGVFDMAKLANGHGALAMDAAVLFAPEALFEELMPEIKNFDYSWSIVSDPEKSESVESGLEEILSRYNSLGLDTVASHIEYEKMQSSVILGSMRALSWLIFLFGVVNLINTTLSNQMSRKRENSILRSVGLTAKQLCWMNITEGMCYAFFATLAVLTVGLPLSIVICAEVSKKSFAGTVVLYQFPFLEMGLFLFVLFGMELSLSVWMARRQKKHSLIEQICLNG